MHGDARTLALTHRGWKAGEGEGAARKGHKGSKQVARHTETACGHGVSSLEPGGRQKRQRHLHNQAAADIHVCRPVHKLRKRARWQYQMPRFHGCFKDAVCNL
eukprot:6177170-Pleurochrysis_carterae.AAC.2